MCHFEQQIGSTFLSVGNNKMQGFVYREDIANYRIKN